MSLPPSSIIGAYRVEDFIASGGMGEVYTARHLELNRLVALKVIGSRTLDSSVATERFRREAKAASRLDHPNICRVYDFGEHEGVLYLVLEYVRGETLRERLAGKGVAPDEALRIGIALAEALDHAHSNGLVHRDLKPGNIVLTRSGPKILDFGLAKRTVPPVTAATDAPHTMESQALTEEGIPIGTLPYMAPEQVRGDEVDSRGDLHALGAILYEMITGRPPFEGGTPAVVAAAILTRMPPSVNELAPTITPAVARAVSRCLAKEPHDRWQTARDLASELRWVAEEPAAAPGSAPPTRRRTRWGRIAMATASVGAIVLLATVAANSGLTGDPPAAALALSVEAPPGVSFPRNHLDAHVSPDGRRILLSGVEDDGRRGLWVRPVSSTTPVRLGVEDGPYRPHTPFWAPDGERVAYFQGERLVSLGLARGNVPQVLAHTTQESRGGSWGDGDVILYAPSPRSGIFLTSPGGDARQVTTPDRERGEIGHVWPHVLPGGQHFLYLVTSSADSVRGIYLGSLDRPQGRRIMASSASAAYAEGHLLFLRGGRLLARPLDFASGQLTGGEVQVLDDVATSSTFQALFSVSRNGVLTWASAEAKDVTELVWSDLEGRSMEVARASGRYRNPSLSSNGRYLAVEEYQGESGDVAVLDLRTGRATRTNDASLEPRDPVLSPDGRSVAFVSQGSDGWSVYRWDIESPVPPRPILGSPSGKMTMDWSVDGGTILYGELTDRGDWDVLALPAEGGAPRPLLDGTHHEIAARLSPSGRHVAYGSDESGTFEVYVEPVPRTGRRCQVSSGGGWEPSWGSDDGSLYYLDPSANLMAVGLPGGERCPDSPPTRLFQTRIGDPRTSRNHFLFAPDRELVLINRLPPDRRAHTVGVLINWPEAALDPVS